MGPNTFSRMATMASSISYLVPVFGSAAGPIFGVTPQSSSGVGGFFAGALFSTGLPLSALALSGLTGVLVSDLGVSWALGAS